MPQSWKNIAHSAPTLQVLKQLAVREQGLLLLRQLAKMFPRGNTFAKANFTLSYPSPDPYGLADGYPSEQVREVVAHLLGEPWHHLENNFYISSPTGQGFFEITDKGWSEAEKPFGICVPDTGTLDCLRFLHKDLQDYGHYFREQKLKEAAAAAFKRVENRLNEIRDASKVLANRGVSGVGLPHSLFDSGDLKFPFPALAASSLASRSAYLQALKNLLASGIGWFRNSFDHEPHNLPDIDEAQTIELLFIASYMLRIIDEASRSGA